MKSLSKPLSRFEKTDSQLQRELHMVSYIAFPRAPGNQLVEPQFSLSEILVIIPVSPTFVHKSVVSFRFTGSQNKTLNVLISTISNLKYSIE